MPIELHADWNHADDVTWLVRPPWVSRYGEHADGRPEPAVQLLGQAEYSATDYFGNEASDVSFYAAAAIQVERYARSSELAGGTRATAFHACGCSMRR